MSHERHHDSPCFLTVLPLSSVAYAILRRSMNGCAINRWAGSKSWLDTPAHGKPASVQIKPDGVQRNIVGEVIKRFEQKGFRLVALKMTQVTVSSPEQSAHGGCGCIGSCDLSLDRGLSSPRWWLRGQSRMAASAAASSPGLHVVDGTATFQPLLCSPQTEHAKEHYSDLSTKPFFNGLVSFICSSPVVAMVWQGEHGVIGTPWMHLFTTNDVTPGEAPVGQADLSRDDREDACTQGPVWWPPAGRCWARPTPPTQPLAPSAATSASTSAGARTRCVCCACAALQLTGLGLSKCTFTCIMHKGGHHQQLAHVCSVSVHPSSLCCCYTAGTSSMALTRWRAHRRRLLCGSQRA